MSATVPRWRGWLWWLVPAAAMALVLGLETDWGRGLHRLAGTPPPIAPKPVETALLPEYRVEGGLAGHAETVNRTLFNPTRRPAPPVAADGGGPRLMQRGQFVLTGTAVGERHIAFLKELAGGKSRAVREGERINGLLVADVRADRVKLTLGDEAEELMLKVAAGPKTTVALPTPPAAVAAPPGAAGSPTAAPAVAEPPNAAARERREAAATTAAAAGNRPATGTAAAAASQAPAPSGSAGPPASIDPAWNEVYERMRQQNPNYPKTK